MTTAIIDGNFMARRAFFSRVGQDLENGTIFGFLKDVAAVIDYLQASRVAFCWDSPYSKRKENSPGYKSARAERWAKLNKEELKREQDFFRQIEDLHRIVTKIGYSDSFYQYGYEADDLIAACCERFEGRLVLVSSDKDLWQLLSDRVSCWNPAQRKMTSLDLFRRIWKLEPHEWIGVKAIAGCDSDDIRGVAGVGEITAAKYVRGELGGSKIIKGIEAAENMIAANRALVQLPFPGTMPCGPSDNYNPTPEKWNRVVKKLEMPMLAGLFPGARRERAKR